MSVIMITKLAKFRNPTIMQSAWLLLLPASLLIGCQGTRPANLGMKDGTLAPCPSSPNCVSSQSSDDAHRVAPLIYSGRAVDAMKKLTAIMQTFPRTSVITISDSYLYAEVTSSIFRFVDDVEFFIDDDTKVIHVRSASRLGTSDLGVNRKRVEEIRRLWNAPAPPS
jgi:uncharacterized protein (DUF1499 family)